MSGLRGLVDGLLPLLPLILLLLVLILLLLLLLIRLILPPLLLRLLLLARLRLLLNKLLHKIANKDGNFPTHNNTTVDKSSITATTTDNVNIMDMMYMELLSQLGADIYST